LRVCCHDLTVILFNIITQWWICYVKILFLCKYGSNLCQFILLKFCINQSKFLLYMSVEFKCLFNQLLLCHSIGAGLYCFLLVCIGECSSPEDCGSNARCVWSSIHEHYECVCNPGFSREGPVCVTLKGL